ncbi:MAG: hypothetical protein K9N46_03495 [Candidatus Marinimicrobia bacterium]|nr:hypothetical protein [Candidatus Neomarinimicrobiota bacterium]MCF7829627.1 hypothetical protein [Candidatus Neomarinimicrobiota bacterium]MCF7879787.1 hypothetical protein [Candidatus Neomarinimicrobiota bacterium]
MNQTIASDVAKQHLGFPADRSLLFVMGGSQGAEPINRHLAKNIRWYHSRERLSLLWQCGEGNLEPYIDYGTTDGRVQVRGFIYEMGMAYSASDIIVARAGALTLSELAIVGKPAILIPLPTAAANHQYYNAMDFANNGAAEVIEQDELASGVLEQTIQRLLEEDDTRTTMAEKAIAHARPQATEKIVESIYALAGYELDV